MTFFRWFFAILILAPFAWPHVRRDWPIVRALLEDAAVPRRDRHRHAQRARLPRPQLHDRDQRRDPQLVHPGDDHRDVVDVPARARCRRCSSPASACRSPACSRSCRRGSLAALAAFRLNGGDLLVILSMAMWSVYTICLRWRPPGLHLLTFLFVLACVGDLCVLPLFLGELAFGRHMAVTLRQRRGARVGRAVLVGARATSSGTTASSRSAPAWPGCSST